MKSLHLVFLGLRLWFYDFPIFILKAMIFGWKANKNPVSIYAATTRAVSVYKVATNNWPPTHGGGENCCRFQWLKKKKSEKEKKNCSRENSAENPLKWQSSWCCRRCWWSLLRAALGNCCHQKKTGRGGGRCCGIGSPAPINSQPPTSIIVLWTALLSA